MTAIRNSSNGEGSAPPPSSIIDQIYKFLASIRFTILILSLIAIGCIAGTLVKQQASAEEYVAHFSESTYAILKFLGLTDVFHAPWFLLLIGLFVINLVFCSTQRVWNLAKATRNPALPDEKSLAAMPFSFSVSGKTVADIVGLKGYKCLTIPGKGAICRKGSISRYGAYIIHASIIVILIGTMMGPPRFGYRGFVTLGKGETRDTITARDESSRSIPLGFGIKCNDFKVSFYEGGEPKEYLSSIEIIENGRTVKKADVRVNHPLFYNGARIYQASYGANTIAVFSIGGKRVELTQGGIYQQGNFSLMLVRFEKQVHNFGPGIQVAYLENGEQKTSWFLLNVPGHRDRTLAQVPIKLMGVTQEFYTGLEVTKDPGVWVVWLGFALILFGLYVNFFMYYRYIYLLQPGNRVVVAGSAPRNKDAFRDEFEKLKERNK